MSRVIPPLLLLLVLTQPVLAAVFIVPTDDSLIERADAIVIATVREMNGVFELSGDIVTEIDLDVQQVLKGDFQPDQPLRLREAGGVVGTEAMFVSESPVYWKGNRALLFLERYEGSWRTWGTSGNPTGDRLILNCPAPAEPIFLS